MPVLETAIEHGRTVGSGSHVASALAYLGRMGGDAAGPQRATDFRRTIDLSYEVGDTIYVLMYVDLYAQALANTDRAESAAILLASVGELSSHMSNPVSIAHQRDIKDGLLTQLGEERFAELTAQGAAFGYEDAVALAFAELDRVIAAADG